MVLNIMTMGKASVVYARWEPIEGRRYYKPIILWSQHNQ